MKFLIENQHREYFNEYGLVEFEGLLSERELAEFQEAVNGEMTSRGGGFWKGHDLWRTSDRARKAVFSWRLAEIASQLSKEKPMRIAFDQFFSGAAPDALKEPVALETISSFQGLTSGLIIRLSGSCEETTLVPKIAGSGVYFSPSASFDMKELFEAEGTFLLIAYVRARGVFIVSPQDPFRSQVQTLKYTVGDRLDEKRNPTIYR